MRFPRFVPCVVCLAVNTLPLFAQSPNGNINGLVSDPSSAAVIGAEIVAANDVTGVQYTTKTNNEGIYVLPGLPPGPYRLQVSKIGFKTLIKPDITLNVQDSLSINFTLLVGAFHEIVTVQGGAPLVNTESATVSTVIDQTYVKNMPLNGRSFQDLILLAPGTITQTPQAPQTGLGVTGEFSVNGQRTESNYYTVDGVSANLGAAAGINMIAGAGASGSVPAATALGTTQALVSVDALQEFRVQSSTYSAEYGRYPGGQFAFETKSGTNQWHGAAYDYLRNGFFDAQDWFNNYFGVKEPGVRQNDFGGTFGGPVNIPRLYNGKDNTFFFVSYEGLRLTAPQAASSSFVPDSILRANTPSPLKGVLDAFPVPNGLDYGNGSAQFIGTWSNPSSLNSSSARLDHVVSDKLRLFFRFSDTDSRTEARGSSATSTSPTTNTTTSYSLHSYTAGASSVFSSRLSNEFRLNYSSNEVTGRVVTDPLGGSTAVDLAQVAGLGPGSDPGVYMLLGSNVVQLFEQLNVGSQKQWNLVDSINVSLGRHQLKFGVDYRRLAPVSTPYDPTAVWLYFSQSSVQSNNASMYLQANAAAYPLYMNLSAFAQDEWRAAQRVSLSFGLRWEVNPPPGVTKGSKPYTVKGASPDYWTLAPRGTPLWRTTWANFAPRVGVTYIVHTAPGWETVARGGGGVFFDTGQQLGSLGFQGPGFSASTYQSVGGSFPVVPPIPAIVNPPTGPFSNVFAFSPHLQLPYALQWNASIEQALDKSQALTLSYVGSHGSRLLQENDFQPVSNPVSGNFLVVQNGLTSDYESLQIQLRRRFARGLTALVSHTWSHCLDFGSQNYLTGYQRGNCDFDVRHNLAAALSYDLPNMGPNAFVRGLLDHWGIDDRLTARTSFPVNLVGQDLVQPNGQLLNAGLDLVGGEPIYLHGDNCSMVLQGLGDLTLGQECPGGRAVNPNAFAQVPIDPSTGNPTRAGNAPRNFVRGFGEWQMNLAIRRDFPIHEQLKVQFRAEAFNIFNHPNFGIVNPNFGQNTFGQATNTLASSPGGSLNSLYRMGGPRSMQFALKLMF